MFSGPLLDIIKQPNSLVSRRFTKRGLSQGDLLRDRYRVIQVLSQGGWGETYIARDLDRPKMPRCVIKMLKPVTEDQASLGMAEDLFKREADTLEGLGQHKQIPRLLAYFNVNQNFYLVQEFIDGLPLSSEILPGLRWSETKVLSLLIEVLSILTFVHGRQVIHRDIKPGNIIRRRYDGRLLLIDFGAVKEIRDPNNITQIGVDPLTVSIGTRGYMPLEQVAGRPRFSSDIYALGIICAQTLTGIEADELPRNDEDEILWQQHSTVSEPVARIVAGMIRSHYRDRYQTAEEVLADIEQAFPEKVRDYKVIAQSEESQPSDDPFQEEDAIITNRYGNRKSLGKPALLPAAGIGLMTLLSIFCITNFRDIRSLSQYASLRSSLNNKDWESADQETFDLMLSVVGPKSKEKGVFDSEEWSKFMNDKNSCKSIVRINNWWERASNGSLGFRSQARMFQEGQRVDPESAGSSFYQKVKWLETDLESTLVEFEYTPNEKIVDYVDGKVPDFINPSEGHLPALMFWESETDQRFSAFYKCQLQN